MSRFFVLSALLLTAVACDPTGPKTPNQFSLEDPTLIDDDSGDGLWQAGERTRILVTVSNLWPDDYMGEVGVRLTADPADAVTIEDEEILFFGIFGNSSFDARFVVDSAPNLPAGSTIDFTIDLVAPNCGGPSSPVPCPEPQQVELTATID